MAEGYVSPIRVKSLSTMLRIVYFISFICYLLQCAAAKNLFQVTVARKVHPNLLRHPIQVMECKEFVTKDLTEHEEGTQVLSQQKL